jgi:glutamate synthase domain-containing protein 2/glutamate synthase domain-containing protein 3
MLVATGATALHPHLLLRLGVADAKPTSAPVSLHKLVKSLEDALKRIMSKMGICTVDGYRGSGLYEVVGLSAAVVDYYLPGIQSRIGGLELADIYEDIRYRAGLGARPVTDLDPNVYRKEVWQALQETARGNEGAWDRFTTLLRDTPPVYLRDLLAFRTPPGRPAPMSAVATESEIIASTFRGAAMSHGALHRVAHRAIAAAFNRFGAASNCGEGGEDPRRDRGGEWAESRSLIRQVGSGRFGVEARYLVHADELQIKIGQGAKPGEGGHLPAEKVTEEIARIRRTRPGVALISPPPHHDIYSIEDLAQVIHNLRQINPRARISVKIPGVTDIGTIAVGVAKAGADVIDVSGMEGGTGAAAASSIEHAGLPLERALSEAHQALVINGLRSQVRLRCDGGLKTGFDVAVVLALGADEVSLGTALMIAEQCIFCHGCAAGNCPAGITTQSDLVARRLMTDKKGRGQDAALPDDETLRYIDALEGVSRYLLALAGEVRGVLAGLGLRRPQDLVGRVDLLHQIVTGHPRHDAVDLSELLLDPSGRPGTAKGGRAASLPVDPTNLLNARLVGDARAAVARTAATDETGPVVLAYDVSTADRAIGATLAGAVTLGEVPLPPGGLVLRLRGAAGQALGFGLVDGLTLELTGFANDMVGEAMSGGRIVLRLPPALGDRDAQSCLGNAAAYGCTGGALLAEGRAGQRFGVRMSGGLLMCEGTGKYAFEYMTGGVGVVLGPTGPVVASGMTGGTVYLSNDDGLAARRVHPDARVEALGADDVETLHALVADFATATGSPRAAALLADWPAAAARFVKVTAAVG